MWRGFFEEEEEKNVKTHSVKVDVQAFCGWGFLLKLMSVASPFLQGLIAGLFGTGGRISEVLALRRDNVDLTLNPEVVIVKQMPLVKRFEKVGEVKKWKCVNHCNKRWDEKPAPLEYRLHKVKEYKGWVTKPLNDHRTFPIRLSEPLTPYFVAWYEKVNGKNTPLFPISRTDAFLKVRGIGEKLNMRIPFSTIHSSELYDHWFRAERACQLAFDYGFGKGDLNEFFGWKEREPSMADWYASLGWIGLARKMGVKV